LFRFLERTTDTTNKAFQYTTVKKKLPNEMKNKKWHNTEGKIYLKFKHNDNYFFKDVHFIVLTFLDILYQCKHNWKYWFVSISGKNYKRRIKKTPNISTICFNLRINIDSNRITKLENKSNFYSVIILWKAKFLVD
jgi:hypothetical protein